MLPHVTPPVEVAVTPIARRQMPNSTSTINRLQSLLSGRGYDIKRLNDKLLVLPVATVSYRNPAGHPTAAIFFTLDKTESFLTVDIPWAFDGSKAVYKDALHQCLLVAAGKVPLLKTQLDPVDGEIRLRVDLPLGKDGFRDGDVLRGIEVLHACVEEWHSPITSAMTNGSFEEPGSQPAARASNGVAQLSEIVRRAGGVNRLKVLFEFRKRLERERNQQKENDDGDHAC